MIVPILMPLRVVLVGVHTLFQDALHALIDHQDDLDVVGHGTDGPDAVRLARHHTPDALVLDAEHPNQHAAQTVLGIRAVAPTTKIVVLGTQRDTSLIQELVRCGASAVLAKTVCGEELVLAIRSVGLGNGTVLMSLQRETVSLLDSGHRLAGPLSPRELDVLWLLAQAMSNAQIARRLFVTEGTVKRHLTNMYAKLEAVSRLDAVKRAGEAGLIDQRGYTPAQRGV